MNTVCRLLVAWLSQPSAAQIDRAWVRNRRFLAALPIAAFVWSFAAAPISVAAVAPAALTGQTLAQPVIGTRVKQAVSLVTLTLSDAAGAVVQTLQATPEHPFFVALPGGDHRVVPAGKLPLGCFLLTRAGPRLTVTGKQEQASHVPVYNFTVKDTHTYFVGTADEG